MTSPGADWRGALVRRHQGRLYRAANDPWDKYGGKLTQAIADAHRDGLSHEQIATHAGRSPEHVKSVLTAMGHLEKGMVGRLRVTRAANTMDRLAHADYTQTKDLTGLSRRQSRKLATAGGVFHHFQNTALERATQAEKAPKSLRMRVKGRRAEKDLDHLNGGVSPARGDAYDYDESAKTPGFKSMGYDKHLTAGVRGGTNGIREGLERGSSSHPQFRSMRHMQAAVADRRGGRTLYRGLSGTHLQRGDVHDAGVGASFTTSRKRAEHFAGEGGRMQMNPKYKDAQHTPVVLKLRHGSRRAVPVGDGFRPEHFLGGKFKVVRTRERNGVTTHTVKQVGKRDASPFGVIHKVDYDYTGGKRVGHKDWDHPTTGMVTHAGRAGYEAGRLRPLHPSTYRRGGRDKRAGKAAVQTLGSYQRGKGGSYSKPVFAHVHEGEAWHSIGAGRDQHFYRGKFTPDKAAS